MDNHGLFTICWWHPPSPGLFWAMVLPVCTGLYCYGWTRYLRFNMSMFPETLLACCTGLILPRLSWQKKTTVMWFLLDWWPEWSYLYHKDLKWIFTACVGPALYVQKEVLSSLYRTLLVVSKGEKRVGATRSACCTHANCDWRWIEAVWFWPLPLYCLP